MPIRPSREEMLMGVAELVAKRSTCSRAHVGAVIAHEGRILVTGYNGAPSGMPHCVHETDPTFGSGRCVVSVHAEANAIAWAARYGISVAGADLYTTLSPCLACSQLLVNTGIKRVIFGSAYRLVEGIELLSEAGIKVELFTSEA